MALNLSKQKFPSFQATPHCLEHNSKPVSFPGVLQLIEAALRDTLRDTQQTVWPSVLNDAKEIIAYKPRVTVDNFKVDF